MLQTNQILEEVKVSIVLGVDVTSTHVYCGCYKKSGNNCELLWADNAVVKNADVGAAIQSVKAKHRLKKADLHMAISGDHVQQFVLGNVAYHSQDIYQKLVQAHLMQHGQCSFEKLAYDYVRCAKDQLWVVAMPLAILNQYLNWAKTMKLSLNELEPSMCGLLRLLPEGHAKKFSLVWMRDNHWHYAVYDGVDVVFERSRSGHELELGLVEWIQQSASQYSFNPVNLDVNELYLFTEAKQGFDIVSNIKQENLKVTWINPNQFTVPGPEYLVTYGLAIKER